MKSFLTALFLLCAVADSLIAYDQTWNTPVTSGQVRDQEASGHLGVLANGDVLSGGNLTLRATQRIVFEPGFRAYSGSTLRAGIDSDQDGFTEADADGIPDPYELLVPALDPFNPADAASPHPDFGLKRVGWCCLVEQRTILSEVKALEEECPPHR